MLLGVFDLDFDARCMACRVLRVLGERDLRRGQGFRREALLPVLLHPMVILGQGLILLALLGRVTAVPDK